MTPVGAGGVGWDGQATEQQCMAGQGWVGWGIYLVREFSIFLVGVG